MSTDYIWRGENKIAAKDVTADDFGADETYVPLDFDYSLLSEKCTNDMLESRKSLKDKISKWAGPVD